MGVGGERYASAALHSEIKPGTHFTGGRVGPRANLDGCGRFDQHRSSIPGLAKP